MIPEVRHVNFARGPLRSYFDEPQKKWNDFFFLFTFLQPFYALFLSFYGKVCKLHGEEYVINRHIRPLRSTAVVITNVLTNNEDVSLPVRSLNDSVTWLIDVHRCLRLVGLKQIHLRKVCGNVSIYICRWHHCSHVTQRSCYSPN